VDPYDPPGIGVLPDLPPERGEVCGVVDREVLDIQDLVLEQVGDRNLRGRVEEHVVPLEVVHVVLEVGVLPGSDDGVLVDDHRGEELGVALVLMGVEEEVDEGPLEPCAVALEAVESASGDLHASVEVDDIQVLGDLEVLLGGEIEHPLPSGLVDDDVLGVVLAYGDVGRGDVGDVEDAVGAYRLELGHPVVVGLDLVRDLPHLGDLRLLLLSLRHLGDLQGDLVANLPQAVVLVGERSPLAVCLQEAVEDGFILVPVPEHSPDHVRL